MTLADPASQGSFISGIAVFVSLALLYSQLRQVSKQIAQAEKNQRALMIQGANKRSIDENIWLREPQMSAVLIKAIDCAEELTQPGPPSVVVNCPEHASEQSGHLYST